MGSTRVGTVLIGLMLFATIGSAQAQDKAAEVNGTPILLAEVDAKLGTNLSKLNEQIFDLRKRQLESMIDQQLLEQEAARRKITIAALVQAEITSRITPVTAEEVTKFYEENKSKLQGDQSLLEPTIKNYITGQRLQSRQLEFVKTLRSAAKVNVLLAAPPIVRAQVTTAGAPVRGAAEAPVTLVEFSDFHCPFCRKASPVLDEVLAKYPGKVKLVYRDFPVASLHQHAPALAEAGRCANEQGKFWEFHDTVFKLDPTQTEPAKLDGLAKQMGLDVAAFQACRTSGKYKASVAASIQEGTNLGINGTPTFFVNGRSLVGAQPLEAFVKLIDEELAARAR